MTMGADNFVFEEIREYRRGFWYPEDDGKLGIPAAITTCYKGEVAGAEGHTYELRVDGDIVSVLNGKTVGQDTVCRFTA